MHATLTRAAVAGPAGKTQQLHRANLCEAKSSVSALLVPVGLVAKELIPGPGQCLGHRKMDTALETFHHALSASA